MLRLGSNSKTRAKILTDFKIPFKQTSGTFDEEKILRDGLFHNNVED